MSLRAVRLHVSQRVVCALIVLAVCPALAQAPSQVALTTADADRCDRKLQAVQRFAEDRQRNKNVDQPLTTTLTEAEINSYMRLKIAGEFPAGVLEPYLTGLGDGRITASAVVDLDAVSKSGSGGGLGRMLGGRLPLTITGTLRGRGGNAIFEFESASISGIPVPKMLLQQVVGHYSRSTDRPAGVNLDAPFPLPSGIRQLDVGLHQVVLVQ